MPDITVNLADAKTHLGQLTERAAAGETVLITKHGKPVAMLNTPRKPVDLKRLRRLMKDMPMQDEEAGQFVRRMRDDARYWWTTWIRAC